MKTSRKLIIRPARPRQNSNPYGMKSRQTYKTRSLTYYETRQEPWRGGQTRGDEKRGVCAAMCPNSIPYSAVTSVVFVMSGSRSGRIGCGWNSVIFYWVGF